MSIRRNAGLALCASALVLALAAGTAAATVEQLVLSRTREVTATSSGTVSFTAGEVTVRCNLSMTASFAAEIAPTRGSTFGSVTRATPSSCEGGERPSVTFLSTPWSMTYQSFSGSQPERMTAVLTLMNGFSLNIASGRLSCLYRGEVGLSYALTRSNPYLIGTVSTLTNSLSLVSGAGCGRTGSIRGSFTFSPVEWIGEFALLPLRANPRIVEAESAQTERTVTFRNIETNNVIAEIGTFSNGGTGWSASIGGCTFQPFIAPEGTCEITVRANGSAGDGAFVLYREAPEGVPTGPRGQVLLIPEP